MIEYFLSGKKLIKKLWQIRRIKNLRNTLSPYHSSLSELARRGTYIYECEENLKEREQALEKANQDLIKREVAILALEKLSLSKT